MWNPSVRITYAQANNGSVAIVRDDMLPGGTKQRAAVPFLKQLVNDGVKEFVYASPFAGYAQIALAASCQAVGAKCVVCAESENGELSEFSKSICNKANVLLFNDLSSAETAASKHAQSPTTYKVPLGFDSPDYRKCLATELSLQWELLCAEIGQPKRLWLPLGSGTLASVFRQVTNVPIICVDVGVLPASDRRIHKARSICNLEYIRSEEPFAKPARHRPPVPSNKFYDAKLWRHIKPNAIDGDLWWNVAG